MHKIIINNCNSIAHGKIEIESGKLNIKYGINGTGKSTIAKALKVANSNEDLQELRSYFSSEPASISVYPSFEKILVYDEDFVNQVVFKEDVVVENSFEVFLKTANYDKKKEKLNIRLEDLHKIISEDEEIVAIKKLLETISKKFSFSTTGRMERKGTYKSILTKQNIYNVPYELNDYKPFFENENIAIPWIDWKNKGDDYDIGDNCPYCTSKIDRPVHEQKKEIFKRTYSKADSKNLKDIVELLECLKEYFVVEKYDELISYIKKDTSEDVIQVIMSKLVNEINLFYAKVQAIEGFGKTKLAVTDISNIESYIREMEIPEFIFDFFGGIKVKDIFRRINEKVNILLKEVGELKREMGALKGEINTRIKKSQEDINEFLRTAGINYELVLDAEDETNNKAILKECFTVEKSDVKKIRKHLSWGEKNAFSLILFMYYADTQNPNLIILDDPVSSFDSNKKYAIMHRMFKNIGQSNVSFEGKTVVLLTHDFEPITDLLVVGKLDESKAKANFLWNEDGTINEKNIDIKSDIKLLLTECVDIAKNPEINIVSRVAFLRKLCELNQKEDAWYWAYEILSCLIHGNKIRKKIANNIYKEMDFDEERIGMNKIREYIQDFDFERLKNETYTVDNMKKQYLSERNAYIKMQLFREMKELAKKGTIEISQMDSAWFKFVDETYHIDNDNLHYLDVMKFNVVPNYIVKKVDEIVVNL